MQLVATAADSVPQPTSFKADFENSLKFTSGAGAQCFWLRRTMVPMDETRRLFTWLSFTLLSTAIPTLVRQASLRTSRLQTSTVLWLTPSSYTMKRNPRIRMRRKGCVMVPAWH